MERLRIKNFLIIEEADFEIGRFNLIIGSQASGKSIIAKLLYFFRKVIEPFSINKNMNIDNLKISILNYFGNIFPPYTWNEQLFTIVYEINGNIINLYNNQKVIIEFSNQLTSYYQELEDLYNKTYNHTKIKYGLKMNKDIEEYNFDIYFNSLLKKINKDFLFIPAGRSFFSTLQNNIFFLLVNNVEIDPLMKEFGANYEKIKRGFNKSDIDIKLANLNSDILKGYYLHYEDKDWIIYNNKKVSLANTSSGQQEALPMLLMLTVWTTQNKKSKIFIEEPEAHLFPVSQKRIIEMLALLYNNYNANFVLTTHSPYILTAINNAILANDVIAEKGKEAVKNIFDPDFAIKYEDVRAYTVEKGRLISIMDDETRLIGASVIDSVSDEFENVFNSLLEL